MSSSSNSAKRRKAEKKLATQKIDERKDDIDALNAKLKKSRTPKVWEDVFGAY
jgi:hypothetical protein